MKHRAKLLSVSVVTVLLIPLFLFTMVLYDKTFYAKEFSKLDVYEKLPQAHDINEQILDFFKGNEALSTHALTASEKSHLHDVRRIFNALAWFMYVLTVMLIILFYFSQKRITTKQHRQQFLATYFLSTGLALILLLAIIGIMLLNFSAAFDAMHTVFFPQGNFVFASDSTLISLYPEQFFIDFVNHVALQSLLFALFLILLGYSAKRL